LVSPQALLRNAFGDNSSGASDGIQQTMERLPHGVRRLAVQLRTPIPVDVLWQVLTDYEQLERFIPNLASSELIYREGSVVRLQQVGSQQLLGLRFSAQVLLELLEHQDQGILNFKMLRGDFRRFEGSWCVKPLTKGSSLLYELTVQGCLGMPIPLIEERLRDDLSSNLSAVEKEAFRRWKEA
jgi:ribosome-associated toxin RatA of RatAB toxin-antitoxin module